MTRRLAEKRAVGDAKAPKFDGTQQFNSGFLRRGDSIEVTFTKAGSYTLLCLIHNGQTVDVTVLSPGMFVPTQAQIDAQAVRGERRGGGGLRPRPPTHAAPRLRSSASR